MRLNLAKLDNAVSIWGTVDSFFFSQSSDVLTLFLVVFKTGVRLNKSNYSAL